MSFAQARGSPRASPRWRADGLKTCLLLNFDRRGWVRANSVEEMDFYWCSVANIRQLFSPDTRFRLAQRQLINHFQNHFELTRKDLMVRNIKRYRRDVEKEGRPGELAFLPTTYQLPADIGLLVEEFRRSGGSPSRSRDEQMWIIKPSSAAQGKGIVIINSLAQAKKWATKLASSQFARDTGYVCSKYIANPLLIGGRKFDLRIFVLVTSYQPLKVRAACGAVARKDRGLKRASRRRHCSPSTTALPPPLTLFIEFHFRSGFTRKASRGSVYKSTTTTPRVSTIRTCT